ncbi:MAG TPA: LysM peptidoglycan-binding domain-containing protein [bacterium]|nr:LysM peptidoglycan-binding domain-containing protein [bacterium]HPV20881.1 LysM peptidoglycan-binding domain-containing protein [bacterium]HPY14788.1 LysM peptidoglycan-binding domain-containing protein [bacterium]HQB08972.1 LysM peptidoglycan-binding domain-containing protein [bacterium]HQM84896.1 LysM peptidoglycan-binding domain-containing protein [bacterium]
MKKVFVALIVLTSFLSAQEELPPSTAEEVPVPSFINLENADLSAAPEKHEVIKGDTLWDISNTYLKSPWYWPKVWSMNPQISNPHLIYPGDMISFRFTGEMTLPAGEGVGSAEGQGSGVEGSEFEDEGETDVLARTGKTLDATPENFKEYVKLGGKYRIDRFKQIDDTVFDVVTKGFIEKGKFEDLGKIVGSFESKELLSTEDNVYVKLGKVSFEVGEYVEFINVKEQIKHPVTKKKVGSIIDIVGRGKVLDVNADRIATVKIVKAFDSIDRGYLVREYIKTEPNIKIAETASDIKAVILTGYDPTAFYGPSYIVYLDKGSNAGLETGNMLSVYRKGDGLDLLDKKVKKNQLPFEMIGELVVMQVFAETSVAIITKSLTGLEAGDSAVSGVIE